MINHKIRYIYNIPNGEIGERGSRWAESMYLNPIRRTHGEVSTVSKKTRQILAEQFSLKYAKCRQLYVYVLYRCDPARCTPRTPLRLSCDPKQLHCGPGGPPKPNCPQLASLIEGYRRQPGTLRLYPSTR